MKIPFQLSLFPEENEESFILRKEIEEIALSCDKVRKGLFARHNELAKMYIELHQRLEILEKNICQKNHG